MVCAKCGKKIDVFDTSNVTLKFEDGLSMCRIFNLCSRCGNSLMTQFIEKTNESENKNEESKETD